MTTLSEQVSACERALILNNKRSMLYSFLTIFYGLIIGLLLYVACAFMASVILALGAIASNYFNLLSLGFSPAAAANYLFGTLAFACFMAIFVSSLTFIAIHWLYKNARAFHATSNKAEAVADACRECIAYLALAPLREKKSKRVLRAIACIPSMED